MEGSGQTDSRPNANWARTCEGILRVEFGKWKSNAVARAISILAAEEHSRRHSSQRVAVALALAACFIGLLVWSGAYFFHWSGAPTLTRTANAEVLIRRNGSDIAARDAFRLRPEDVVMAKGSAGAMIHYSREATRLELAGGTEMRLLSWKHGKQFELKRGEVTATVAGQLANRPMIWKTASHRRRFIHASGSAHWLGATRAFARREVVEIGANCFAVAANEKDLVVHPLASGAGTILREVWRDVFGNTVADLINSPRFSSPPDEIEALDHLEAMSSSDHYGARIRGWLHPPVSGDYVFWIASDDASELWLSADDDPHTKQKIAQVQLWTNESDWDAHPSQRSAPIRLEAGRRCYIEVLHKQETAADHLSVAWKIPGENRTVIAGRYLSPFQQTIK